MRHMFNADFYPTPTGLARRMLDKLTGRPRHFLEPSAGKGNIAEAIKSKYNIYTTTIDCIEKEPELASILHSKDFSVVGHDWLDYSGVCYYDAIVMNPPFSEGVHHLLKAWNFLHDGEIVCLLNQETLDNPCTEDRRFLAEIIRQHGTVERLGDCFKQAERPTGVAVAMVYLKKQSGDDSVDLWATNTDERSVNDDIGPDDELPALIDRLGNMQHHFDSANEHMLKAFAHIRKANLYLEANGIHVGSDYERIISLALGNVNSARAEFIRKHRGDAWKAVFEKMEYRKWLDKKQTESFVRDIERNGNIPFTKENIKGTLQNVFRARGELFEKSVANVFDELTKHHKDNTNGTEGWKSNSSFKVNKKLVFPYGCRFCKIFHKFETYWSSGIIDIYNDLDRVLCVMGGKDFAECRTIGAAMTEAFRANNTMIVESDHFHIRFFKKGTVHLVFKDVYLMEQFNKMASKGKNWIGQEHR